MVYKITRDEFSITTDCNKLDLDAVHRFLNDTFWAKGIPRETMIRSLEGSLNFGLFWKREQIGFARVVSDFATFAYLCDVYIEPSFRGRGLSAWLMECILKHPELQGLRRWCLVSRDAKGLYEKFGFEVSQHGEWMEIQRSDLYLKTKNF